MIFDDCLSAVDTVTEEKILRGLNHVMKNKTTVLISHRISTIMHADQIIVLNEGRIVEKGTHSELIKSKGLYSEMFDKQQIEKNPAAY
jgi:ATP-binding cassette subfamily B protein